MANELLFKNFTVGQVKEENGSMIIEGYGAIFGNIDSYGDVINNGAFTKTLMERKDRIAFAYQHDIWNPIGKIQEIYEDDKGLFVKVMVSASEGDIQTKIREGILKEMSIGYREINSQPGTQDGVDVNYISEVKLFEISLVTIAANPLAIITGMKSEERKSFVDTEFDRIIALERNQSMKFELMKLKSEIQALINLEPETKKDESTLKEEPLTLDDNLFTKNLKFVL